MMYAHARMLDTSNLSPFLKVTVQKKKLILTGVQLKATLEWQCIGLCKVVNQETLWFFTILAMVHSRGTTLEMRWMAMMKHSAPWILKLGMIVDDEINATIVRPLPPRVKLHAIIDACHSGTVLDLPFLCRMDR